MPADSCQHCCLLGPLNPCLLKLPCLRLPAACLLGSRFPLAACSPPPSLLAARLLRTKSSATSAHRLAHGCVPQLGQWWPVCSREGGMGSCMVVVGCRCRCLLVKSWHPFCCPIEWSMGLFRLSRPQTFAACRIAVQSCTAPSLPGPEASASATLPHPLPAACSPPCAGPSCLFQAPRGPAGGINTLGGCAKRDAHYLGTQMERWQVVFRGWAQPASTSAALNL